MNAQAEVKPTVLRCAVYTRKSSEEGLDQSFNSLHAQRDACEAYVRSQVGEGWMCLAAQYDDGGISGGTMERPGLKRLLADIVAGAIDCVVVYKVDRLTRSLTDFAKIVDAFDKAGVSFVSVTQAFNTTTSMGRLTLNVLLSFAQFEREVTGERIRDKLAMSKAKGMWMGSVTPLGYDKGDHVLVVNPGEAELVRSIYGRYLEIGSAHALCAELDAEGVRSKTWVTTKGRRLGEANITRGALFHILQNRHYLGEIIHKGTSHPGLHPAIVDKVLFDKVQVKLAANRVVRRARTVKTASHPLTGLVFAEDGQRFSPTFSCGRAGRLHRYYVLSDVQQGKTNPLHPDAIVRVGADALETFILTELRRLTGKPQLSAADVPALLSRIELRVSDTHLVLDLAAASSGAAWWLQDLEARVGPGERVQVEPNGAAIRISLPRRMKLRGGKSWTAFNGAPSSAPVIDAGLVDGLQRAHHLATNWSNQDRSDYRRRLRKLAFLSPSVQRLIITGRQPAGLSLGDLLTSDPPLRWSEQGAWLQALAQK